MLSKITEKISGAADHFLKRNKHKRKHRLITLQLRIDPFCFSAYCYTCCQQLRRCEVVALPTDVLCTDESHPCHTTAALCTDSQQPK